MSDCRKCKTSVKIDHIPLCGEYRLVAKILNSVSLLVKLQKEEILQELGYLNSGVLEPYKVSWCPYVE